MGSIAEGTGGILQECKQGAAEGFVSTRKSFRKLRICFLFDYFLDADDADWNIKKIRVICVIRVKAIANLSFRHESYHRHGHSDGMPLIAGNRP